MAAISQRPIAKESGGNRYCDGNCRILFTGCAYL